MADERFQRYFHEGDRVHTQLTYTEEGRVVPMLGEPLTRHRRARKVLSLPDGASSGGTVYCLVWTHPGCESALRISVNGQLFNCAPKPEYPFQHWEVLSVSAEVLRSGENTMEFWTDCRAQTGWSLALETGHRDPRSYVSFDGGKCWQNERMGLHQVHRGEYVVRIRTSTGMPTAPPRFVWERPDHERLAELRALIPSEIPKIEDRWLRARALASWVSQWWMYRSNSPTNLYTPWDPFTIPAWNEGMHVPGGSDGSIRFCVHYGITFACACLACGIPARCAIGTAGINSVGGHFVSEVWHDKLQRWCMIDPNLDVTFVKDGRPLGAEEVYDYRDELAELAEYGPGADFQQRRTGSFLNDAVLHGKPLRLTSVWYRNDFLSRPDMTLPTHGHQVYCETGIVWRNHNVEGDELGMFPFIAGDDYFNEPPPPEWS